MRKLCAAVAACLLLGTAAAAEGLLAAFPDPDPPPATENYSGYTSAPYVGLLGGYSAGQLAVEGFDFSAQGLLGGAYAGWNFRFPGLVAGFEGDFVLTDINADQGVVTFKAKSNYIATVRARAGLPLGPVLLYGTGGVALTEAEVAVPGASDTEQMFGYVVGGGVEIEMTRTLHVRLEALHYMFGDESFTLGGGSGNVELDQTMVRVGAGFKLN